MRIDLITSDMMRVYDELFRTAEEKEAYKRLVSFDAADDVGTIKRFYVPLIFSWNLNVGLSLPLIALHTTAALKSTGTIKTPQTIVVC